MNNETSQYNHREGRPVSEKVCNYDKMIDYAKMIHETNSKFNLSGHKSFEEIKADLVDNTLLDLNPESVPRGTSFVDIGTGSGIPGMIIAIGNPSVQGTLIDSNSKKIAFIQELAQKLELTNVRAVCARAEDFCKEHTEQFDYSFTRAFGPVYYSIEFSMPVLKMGGLLHIFSRRNAGDLSDDMLQHLKDCGGACLCEGSVDIKNMFNDNNRGICLVKVFQTPSKYPRRFPVIKREAARIPEFKEG